ncbi:MAG TPA: PIG-L family deacetylase [Verrucomicrobiota bacterium]|nr:PIG-L family deacetylase [Verrucomicrobiota bacterium]HRZ37999.1 PIG-L family deacetylase [Candidatus Paceibacterota bacterium]HRZ58172.1 PIG-L family deacetylase [Candidatus Paceibacterota bacterium]
MNPYHHLVNEYARYAREAKNYPLGGFPPAPKPEIPANAPKALIFSPHPDDECIVGGLALRLLREARMNVINVAVTQGSNPARRAGRFEELRNACQYLGFGLLQTGPTGLEKVNRKTRQGQPAVWQPMVRTIAEILLEHQPRVIFFPHDQDWNSTHEGVHCLVTDALQAIGARLSCFSVEIEYWGQMDDPNLMVELTATDVADMVTALTFHVGEVKRNPYHLVLPPWMQDNVRRGGELVGGQGQAAPDFVFATLYRLRRWTGARLERFYEGGRNLPAGVNPSSLFA